MTRRSVKNMDLLRLRSHVADDIMKATDDEILCQYAEDFGPPEVNAERMRRMFEKTVLLANKDRLAAARAGASAHRPAPSSVVVPIAEARQKLRQALAERAGDAGFMLAARKETELSDEDVLDMLQAMHELGILK
jgi:hypothetical protein